MIPRLSSCSDRKDGRGQSFKGLSAYLFNGSQGEPDPARTAWAETLNCHCSDPSQAWAEMAWTHQHTDELKAAAGVRRGGQRNEFPVWHVSLNWKDDQAPTRADMMAAAHGLLARFGLEEHQVLAVAHEDTGHAHLHLMVNLVNPHDGRTVDVSRSTKLRLSAWALDYEREHGTILCQQREENWAKRRDNRALQELMAANAVAHGREAPTLPRTYGKADSRPLWQMKQQAADMGVSQEGLGRLGQLFRGAWNEHFTQERELAANPPAPTAEAILERLTRGESTFTRADLARAVNVTTSSADEFTNLMARIEASPELMKAPLDPTRLSTRTMVRTEEEMAHAADALAATSKHAVPAAADRVIMATHLSEEQRSALAHVTQAQGIACLVGYAGTGKSTMLGTAREMWERGGYNVRGFALSGIAAENLEGGSGISSTTLHALQWQLKHGRAALTSKDILVVDEAGMVGSRQMHAVLTAARDAGAKVVLVGDPSQLQAIDAGGAFQAIIDRVGTARMTQVRRQRAEWQHHATRDLAEGRVTDALRGYEVAGAIRPHATKEAASAELVRQWAVGLRDDFVAGKPPALILAATRKDVAALNSQARTAMQAAGVLGEDITIKVREETIGEATRDFRMRVAHGERLLFTKNDKRLGVRNGMLGTLEYASNGKLTVRLDGLERRVVHIDLSTYRNLAHGYALTIHKAQGVTVDRVHVLASRAMDRHSTYVALSRHRDAVTLHYSQADARDIEALAKRLGRDRSKGTTLDHWGHPQRARTAERIVVARGLSDTLNRSARDTREDRERTERTSGAKSAWRSATPEKGTWRPPSFGRER